MGVRLPQFNSHSTTTIWARNLANGDVAVVLYNKGIENATCSDQWKRFHGGYWDACRPGENYPNAQPISFTGLELKEAQRQCCAQSNCTGFNYNAADGSGNFTSVQGCGWVRSNTSVGFTKIVTPPTPADITVEFADVHLFGSIFVYDIWAKKVVGTFKERYIAKRVPGHGVAF